MDWERLVVSVVGFFLGHQCVLQVLVIENVPSGYSPMLTPPLLYLA